MPPQSDILRQDLDTIDVDVNSGIRCIAEGRYEDAAFVLKNAAKRSKNAMVLMTIEQ